VVYRLSRFSPPFDIILPLTQPRAAGKKEISLINTEKENAVKGLQPHDGNKNVEYVLTKAEAENLSREIPNVDFEELENSIRYYLENDLEKHEITISFPKATKELKLNELWARFIAKELSNQIREWI
jgi:hypothetical protein